MNQDTLFFPVEIAHEIGLPANTINAMKAKGCRFYGKKTTIRWVREFIEQETAEIPPVNMAEGRPRGNPQGRSRS